MEGFRGRAVGLSFTLRYVRAGREAGPMAVPSEETRMSPDSRSLGSIDQVKFLTVAEVAAVMRVSKMSVYRMIHAGDIEAVRFGRNFRVPESAVDNYLRNSIYDVG